MSISRFATLGLVCLVASACTVVLQPAANQPRQDPSATQHDVDVSVVDREPAPTPTAQEPVRRPPVHEPVRRPPAQEPVARPPVQEPRRLPSNPAPETGYEEPDSPSRRTSPRSNRLNLGVPPGHLPGPGECRVWVQGLAPGQQARARSCSGILATAPVGSWILYRPAQYQRQVRVRYLHENRQMVIAVRAFDAETGAYLRDYALEEDDSNMGPVAVGPRPTIRPGGDRTGNRGNSGAAPGGVGTPRDTNTNAGNNGVAVGRGNNPKDNASAQANRGNSATPARQPRNTSAVETVTGGGDNAAEGPRGDRTKIPIERRGVSEDTSPVQNDHADLRVRPRYFPPAGQCRVWIPELAYGRQARPASCNGITNNAPAGAWILRRTVAQPDVIHVDYVDEETAGVIVRTGTFDAATGTALQSAEVEPRK